MHLEGKGEERSTLLEEWFFLKATLLFRQLSGEGTLLQGFVFKN